MTIIGLIPAGGKATRIYGIQKYLLPTPEGTLLDVLRRRMVKAGIADIRTIYDEYPTLCHALRATVTSGEGNTLFAMPDTYWTDEIALEKLMVTLNKGADVAVGIWHIRPDQIGKLGMCRLTENYEVLEVVDKDPDCPGIWAWGAIAWRPYFWHCIRAEDAHLGIALNRAIADGAKVQAVKMTGDYHDAGTPDEYFRLCSTWHREAVNHA